MLDIPSLFSCKELKMLKCLSETIIILKRNKVSTMMKKAKADYYSNLFDEVDTAAAYLQKWTEKPTN